MGPCDTWMPSLWGFVTAVPGHSCTTPVLNPAPHTLRPAALNSGGCAPHPTPGLGPRPPEAWLLRQGRGGGPVCSHTASGKLTLAWVGHRHTLTSVLCARPSEAMAVQVSRGGRHQWPQTGRLKETDIDSLRFWSQKSQIEASQGHVPGGLLPAASSFWGPGVPGRVPPPPTSVVALLTRAPGPG